MKKRQLLYDNFVKEYGQESTNAIQAGSLLANALIGMYRSIEAERLLTKLSVICKRLHGPQHDITRQAESDLQRCKVRYVKIKHRQEWEWFQALRYEEKCVVQGPVLNPRKVQEEETFTVATKDIRPDLGTPVICHGFGDSLSHLNGKIGDLRSWDEETDDLYYDIHFEEKDLEPRFVEPENIRIIFELPDE